MWLAGARLCFEAPHSLFSPDAKLTFHSWQLRGVGGERQCHGDGGMRVDGGLAGLVVPWTEVPR